MKEFHVENDEQKIIEELLLAIDHVYWLLIDKKLTHGSEWGKIKSAREKYLPR